MGEYTVKTGENLWNICKNFYNLKSNTEIAKKVKEVASKNSLKNGGNLIFAGQKIKLDDSGNSATSKGKQQGAREYSTEVTKAVTDKINFNNITTYDDITRLESSSVSIFGSNIQTDEQKNGAYTDYSQKLLLDYYDENHDGIVTIEEFAKREQKGGETTMDLTNKKLNDDVIAMGGQPMEISDEEQAQQKLISQRSANLFAQNLDINGNGQIDAAELAFFNKIADGLDGKEDGVIYASNESQMFQSVTGMNADNKSYNEVVNKYLLGQTLTAEEEQILKQSQQAIRSALGKASGINIEG